MKALMKASYGDLSIWRGIGSPREYVGEYAGSCSLGRPQKNWIDTAKECLKKRGLDVRQARKMAQDRSEWWGFVRGNAWSLARRMNPDLDEIPQLCVATTIWSL